MGRTRLRGIEIAGFKLAIESPPDFDWDWPARGLSQLACAPVDPDVYIGVSVGVLTPKSWEPITYSYEDGTFDVGRVGDEWWIAVHVGGQRFSRVARFDQHFREGEVMISPAALNGCRHPVDGPLLDLLLTHRVIGAGGLVMTGSAMIERGRAIAVLSSESGLDVTSALGEQPDARITPGSRFAITRRDGSIWVHGLPGSHGHPGAAVCGRLDGIHLVTRAETVFAQPVDGEAVVSELLHHAVAPVHAPDMADRLMSGAAAVARSVPMLRLGVPEERRVVPFAWGRRQAGQGFSVSTAS